MASPADDDRVLRAGRAGVAADDHPVPPIRTDQGLLLPCGWAPDVIVPLRDSGHDLVATALLQGGEILWVMATTKGVLDNLGSGRPPRDD